MINHERLVDSNDNNNDDINNNYTFFLQCPTTDRLGRTNVIACAPAHDSRFLCSDFVHTYPRRVVFICVLLLTVCAVVVHRKVSWSNHSERRLHADTNTATLCSHVAPTSHLRGTYVSYGKHFQSGLSAFKAHEMQSPSTQSQLSDGNCEAEELQG